MYLKRTGVYCIGLFLTCAGVAMVLRAGWGVDAWNGVFAGLARVTACSIGIWSMVIQGLFWAIASFLNKKADLGCVVPIVMKGVMLDLSKAAVFSLPVPDALWIRGLLFFLGYALVGIGTGVYVEMGFSKMPIDGLMMALADFFSWDVKRSRLLIEGIGFTCLLLVRGPLGIGTVFITFTIGCAVSESRDRVRQAILKEKKHEGRRLNCQ